MEGISEKHFSIDAGIGEKMEGCPYSLFEDGHDVQEYIIPPKGYRFTGFKFVPLPGNQVYDGKLMAQYEKEPLKERMAPLMQVLGWILIASIIIGLIVVLTVGIFKPQKSRNYEPQRPTETPTLVADTTLEEDTTPLQPEDDTEEVVEQVVEEEEVVEVQEPVVETQQPVVTDNNQLFKQEFWALIHQRAIQMDDYDALYKKYKNLAEGEEFDYLRFTMLKDYPSYKEWYTKFRKISKTELESISSIEALKNKIKEIQ